MRVAINFDFIGLMVGEVEAEEKIFGKLLFKSLEVEATF